MSNDNMDDLKADAQNAEAELNMSAQLLSDAVLEVDEAKGRYSLAAEEHERASKAYGEACDAELMQQLDEEARQ